MSHPIPLTLAQIAIRQDAEGRYCLNDLHKASGGVNHHRPSKWLANKQTKEQIAVLSREALIRASHFDDGSKLNTEKLETRIWASNQDLNSLNSGYLKDGIPALLLDSQSPNTGFGISPLNSIHGGEWNGSYVVKALVYSYAMWISAEFHLQVIRTYDALVTGALDEFEQHLNESYQYRIQNEKYWLNRYPHWGAIRAHVLSGERYRDIAVALSYSVGRVVRAVKSMIRVGLLSPSKVAEVQQGASKRAALRQTAGWGQLALALEGGAA